MKVMQNALRIYVYNKLILGKLTLKKGGRDNMEMNSYFIIKSFFEFFLPQHWLNIFVYR